MLQLLRALEDFAEISELEEVQRCCPDRIVVPQNLDWSLQLHEVAVAVNSALPEMTDGIATPSLEVLVQHTDAVAAAWSLQSLSSRNDSVLNHSDDSWSPKQDDLEWIDRAISQLSDLRPPIHSEERSLAAWFAMPTADDILLKRSGANNKSVLGTALSGAGFLPLPSILTIGSSLSNQLRLLGRFSGISSSNQIRIEEPAQETLVMITAALQEEQGFERRLPCPSPLYCPVTGIRLSNFTCDEAVPSILSCGHILSAKAVQQLLTLRSRREPALRECLACPYCSATCAREVLRHITLI